MEYQFDHRHRYRFRLLYFVCINKLVVPLLNNEIHAYQEKEKGLHRIISDQHSLEGFFLVPKALAWILEPHAKEFYIKDSPEESACLTSKKDHPHRKYMFRGVYVICKDNKIITANTDSINVYEERKHCEHLVEHPTNHRAWENKKKPLPVYTIELFLLVPEGYWWILTYYARYFLIKDRDPHELY